MKLNLLLCQIRQIETYTLDNFSRVDGLDLGDMRDVAIALQRAAKTIHKHVDEQLVAPSYSCGLLDKLRPAPEPKEPA